MTTQNRTTLALLALVLVAVLALVWIRQSSDRPITDVMTADSVEAAVASAATKDEVTTVAEDTAARVYSYRWQTLAADKAAARELLTGDMLTQYDRTMAGVATSSRRDRTVVQAEVVASALVSATTTTARVLVFVNQATDRVDLEEPTLDLDRVLVTLVRAGGEWKVSELDAL